jgi:hypothetical protein
MTYTKVSGSILMSSETPLSDPGDEFVSEFRERMNIVCSRALFHSNSVLNVSGKNSVDNSTMIYYNKCVRFSRMYRENKR